MKWTITTCFVFLCFAHVPAARASSEINAFAPGVTTAYAVIRERDGDVWYVSGQAFEAWGTGARTAADYDISLTDKSGDMFVGDFDANISAGSYHIVTHYQAGGAPADTDPAVWTEYGYWDGDEWFGGSLASDVNNVDFPTKEEIREEIDSNSTQLALIVADTNELQTDWTDGGRLDVILDAIKAMTDLIAIEVTDVATGEDANSFIVTDIIEVDDALDFHIVMVTDGDDGHSELRWIARLEADKTITVDRDFGFTPAAGDIVRVMGTGYGGWLRWIANHINVAPETVDFRTGARTGGTATLNADDEDP